MYTERWVRGLISGLFKSKLHKYNEVLDPSNPYTIYNKALRMLSAVDITTQNTTKRIVGTWVGLCIKRLNQTDHYELICDIMQKAKFTGMYEHINCSYIVTDRQLYTQL